jgi:hypothetical protein
VTFVRDIETTLERGLKMHDGRKNRRIKHVLPTKQV